MQNQEGKEGNFAVFCIKLPLSQNILLGNRKTDSA